MLRFKNVRILFTLKADPPTGSPRALARILTNSPDREERLHDSMGMACSTPAPSAYSYHDHNHRQLRLDSHTPPAQPTHTSGNHNSRLSSVHGEPNTGTDIPPIPIYRPSHPSTIVHDTLSPVSLLVLFWGIIQRESERQTKSTPFFLAFARSFRIFFCKFMGLLEIRHNILHLYPFLSCAV